MPKDQITITAPVEGDYKGNPTLAIPTASGKPFCFGVEKAAAILKHLEAIKAFSTKNPSKVKANPADAARSLSKEELLAILAEK